LCDLQYDSTLVITLEQKGKAAIFKGTSADDESPLNMTLALYSSTLITSFQRIISMFFTAVVC
jgi:hypothetical protein